MKDALEAFEEMGPYGDLFGEPEDRWWRILDDASLFNMGPENWQSVYKVFPELAAQELRRDFNQSDIREVKDLVSILCQYREPEEDDYEDAICAIAKTGLWLIVADGEAFKYGELLLVFIDKKGNVIRQTGIEPEVLPDLPHYKLRGSITESEFWTDAEVGKKYKTREIMRAVLPRAMAEDE